MFRAELTKLLSEELGLEYEVLRDSANEGSVGLPSKPDLHAEIESALKFRTNYDLDLQYLVLLFTVISTKVHAPSCPDKHNCYRNYCTQYEDGSYSCRQGCNRGYWGMIAVLFFVQKVALMCVTKLIEHVYVNHTLPAKHVRPVNAESMEANVTQIVPEDV
ncbi:uncharacterized protein LOC127857296 [Dreissena polymorpha]|uniref:uncharacterized protein LOC127857296 n=1 Tax=Dreissena polymorpha TaxID=45954 RepID=UPI0022652673|nr:uncharacterized protein LOC127857296 [Dreissena polymorpha]